MQNPMSGFDKSTGTSVVLEPGMKLEDILGPVGQRQKFQPTRVNGETVNDAALDKAGAEVGSAVSDVLGPESQWQRHRPSDVHASGHSRAPVMPTKTAMPAQKNPARSAFGNGLKS